MEAHTNTNNETKNIVFMPGVFNETMQLLNDAHDYFHQYGQSDQARIEGELRPLYSCEMSRITLRLSSIMAWLLVQRAVFAGQLDAQDAANKYSLDFQEICRVDNQVLHGVLPSYVCFLLDSTYELYERVFRLDEQIKQQHQIH
ncbi:MAG: DUF1465 family protein [Rickettsiales bacterium]